MVSSYQNASSKLVIVTRSRTRPVDLNIACQSGTGRLDKNLELMVTEMDLQAGEKVVPVNLVDEISPQQYIRQVLTHQNERRREVLCLHAAQSTRPQK